MKVSHCQMWFNEKLVSSKLELSLCISLSYCKIIFIFIDLCALSNLRIECFQLPWLFL